MGRIADDRSMMLDNHPDTALDHPASVTLPPIQPQSQVPSQADHSNEIQDGRQALVSHHDYMNTSDRWMAGGAPPNTDMSNHGQFDTNTHPGNLTNGYPVMIDQILSEAFAYSYEPPPPAVAHPSTTGPMYNGDQAIWSQVGHT